MDLAQKVAALEAELAEIKAQQAVPEELKNLVREMTIETIKDAQRPGGVLHKR